MWTDIFESIRLSLNVFLFGREEAGSCNLIAVNSKNTFKTAKQIQQ